MSWETNFVLLLLLTFVMYRRHVLAQRLARAEARVRANPLLPLMRQADRRLPWQ